MLLYDLDPGLLGGLARWLVETGAGPGAAYRTVVVGAGAGEDDLWVGLRPPRRGEALPFSPEPGPLAEVPGRPPAVVLVPDLARTGMAGARAAVTALGSDVLHLERDGLEALWRPRARWLAACRREDMGKLSPHLLDRFAVRVDAAGLREGDLPGPAPIRPRRTARMTAAAVDRAVRVGGAAPGVRRELALARIARCLATLDGAVTVDAAAVDEAARLLGFAEPETGPEPPAPVAAGGRGAEGRPAVAAPDRPVEASHAVREVVAAPPVEPLAAGPLPPVAVDTPYPEDVLDGEREPMSLRAPWARRSTVRALRGAPLGTVPAHHVHDIAVVATLLEAAKHQAVRCPDHFAGDPRPPHLAPPDLRRYRRAQVPGRLFALLLDHTCRGDWDWYEALSPFLRWSYTQRAVVCVVEVGARDAPGELAARRRIGRNLLDPGIVRALDGAPGRATPLAHGLVLVADSLTRHLHRERAAVEEALLVVVTDGRGNVPLRDSVSGRAPEGVGRRGVEDALSVAREIRAMRRVRVVLVDPRPHAGAGLVAELGEALGGAVVPGRDHPDGA
ncbi:magnesium chelatase [Actinomadura vinacea]|uniref:Magnesium chelatase n=1 Tax=Actinomadura vinacea TaxID=115336 RepID=A0ABN3J775_9ACTN